MISFLDGSIFLKCNRCGTFYKDIVKIINLKFIEKHASKKHFCPKCVLKRAIKLNYKGKNKYIF